MGLSVYELLRKRKACNLKKARGMWMSQTAAGLRRKRFPFRVWSFFKTWYQNTCAKYASAFYSRPQFILLKLSNMSHCYFNRRLEKPINHHIILLVYALRLARCDSPQTFADLCSNEISTSEITLTPSPITTSKAQMETLMIQLTVIFNIRYLPYRTITDTIHIHFHLQ
jgi:hypothetical protein